MHNFAHKIYKKRKKINKFFGLTSLKNNIQKYKKQKEILEMARVAKDNKLNEKILADLKKGDLKWAEIAEKHGVNVNYIRSVHGIFKHELTVDNSANKGVTTYYKGSRISDGKSSPVQKFNLNDLSDEELDKMGLSRFKKNA